MQDFSTISICLSADERYIWHLVETIWSIRKVSSARKTNVYVLLDVADSEKFHSIASELVRFSTKTMEIIPIDVNSSTSMDKSKISITKDITYASYARLFLPELFPMLDKILWLDCDLVVRKPLDEFWDVDVRGRYAAAIDDVTMEYSIRVELDECNVKRYFNAGVILLNLEKIRKDGIDKKFFDVMYNTKPRFQDQTVLNKCFKENVVWLSPRFNLHYSSFANTRFHSWIDKVYGERIPENSNIPTIVHFTGVGTKPWQEHPARFYYDEYIRNASEAASFVGSSSPCNFNIVRIHLRETMRKIRLANIQQPVYIPKIKDRNIFVCMTSYPRRINYVSDTIATILEQSIKPDAIFVTLSRSEFPRGYDSLPENLRHLVESGHVTINWTDENTKTMKKLFPVLDHMDGRDLAVIVDDDIIFDPDFIKTRLNDFYKYGERFAISGTHRIWERTHCIISSAGTMIERRMLNGWERFLDDTVVKTYEDDWAYTFIMLLNDCYFVACSTYPLTAYRFAKLAPSGCYRTKYTISVMLKKFRELEHDRKLAAED